ncbi:SDR family NAD(P)-dependent oxidoreductase [Pukyongiella litopenaei]|uniref:SDR family NAD(P)-dependent oxidoreductase n=1 Tax=Pukyongiella litopenaei TaxID=2605946 RepID=A0A2S0MUL6_9RHOB|nr:SDR family NAD(P)-dependent oxidoreductase [Pukyongiella litopenaei]AVO39568.1 SDR family NAD(P)-dependent oxidoreductase [Pukyongiella litopenaei]
MTRTAVVTGGAGGLGRALSGQLRARGWFTALVDLPGPELEAATGTRRCSTHGCDLTVPDQLRRTCAEIIAARPSIDLVIYNAGISQSGAFADLPCETHRKVFEINYFAAVDCARAFLPALRAAGGTHLAISSVAGFAPLYHRTAYAASKHALEGFFKSLRAEEAPHGVGVAIAAPSFIATNPAVGPAPETGIMRPGSAADGIDAMTPEAAARIILRGLDRGRDHIPVGRVARMASLLNRLSPALYQREMRRRIRGRSAAS